MRPLTSPHVEHAPRTRNHSKGATSTLVPSFRSRIVRSLRATLPDSTRRSSAEDSGAGASVGLLSAERDSQWTDDFCHITRDDLPIQLDDPPVPSTPASSSATLRPGGANPLDALHSRFSLNRLKNYSHVSIRRTKSRATKVTRLPFLQKKSAESSHSILDDFPQPPSHIPTPVTPSPVAYTWPSASHCDTPVSKLEQVLQERAIGGETRRAKSIGPPASINTGTEKSIISSAGRKGPVGRLRSLARTLTSRLTIRDSKPPVTPVSKDIVEPQSQNTRLHTRSLPVEPPQVKPLPDVPIGATDDTNSPEARSVPCSKSYQIIDPVELVASPSPLIGDEFLALSARNSFIPPSPSWLSRNVQHLVPGGEEAVPSSPSPLPIPPRILVRNASNTSLLSPLEATAGWLEYPEIRRSFMSVSRTSSMGESRTELLYKQDLPEALLLKATNSSVPTPTAAIPSPLAIPSSPSYFHFISRVEFHQPQSVSSSPDSKPTLVSDSPRDISHSDPDPNPDFSYVFSNLLPDTDTPLAHMNYEKRTDVVDYGGEADYSNMQWFKDAPPPHVRAPPPAQPTGTPYIPDQAVIEQNEAFEFALSAAPNVLYARYKQYGQLGVLAWCSEFGELIDNLKDLGFGGNMFVSTRTQALKTCEEILKLRLDVQMQIIVMYLSSQVARLRRFLDGEHSWSDYPEPNFPLDPNAYGK